MAPPRNVTLGIGAIYALYYIAIALALPAKEGIVLVVVAAAHVVVGGIAAATDEDGFEIATATRYDFRSQSAGAVLAVIADLCLTAALVTAAIHVAHPNDSLFYAAWTSALLGNTACFLTHVQNLKRQRLKSNEAVASLIHAPLL